MKKITRNLSIFVSISMFLLVVVLSYFFVSCGSKKSSKTTTAEYELEPRYGGVYHSWLMSDPTTFDPAQMWDVSSHGAISACLYNGLVRFDVDGNLVPDLAERWEVSPDGKVYTFYLRKNVKYHNGDHFKAQDVVYNFKRLLSSPKASYTWLLEKVVGAKEFMKDTTKGLPGIEVLDDYTLRITLTQPHAPFLSGLCMPQAYIASPRACEELKDKFGQNPVGTGPFKLKKWEPDKLVVFEANLDYFEGRPYLDEIEYRIIKEEMTAWAEFEVGRLDATGIPQAEFQRVINDPKYKPYIISRPGLTSYGIRIMCNRPPLNNKKLRQALNYAVDRKKILETLLNNRGIIATGPVPVGIPGYKSLAKGYEYNPEKAKQLLREAGYPNGFTFEIWQGESKEILHITEAFQSYYKAVGINAKLVQNEWSVLRQAIRKGDIDSWYMGWAADYLDAEDFLYPLFHSRNIPDGGNAFRYSNPQVDKILDEAHRSLDKNKQIALLQEAEKIIVDDAPWVFFYYPINYVIHQPWVHNLKIPLIYNADKMDKVWISPH